MICVPGRSEYSNPCRETVHYFLGEPMLGDFLADGLEEFAGWPDERITPDSSSPSGRDEDERTQR
jgi:hypothetical protein